jgi:hypothetical protein
MIGVAQMCGKGESCSEITWDGEADHMTKAFPPYNEGEQTNQGDKTKAEAKS